MTVNFASTRPVVRAGQHQDSCKCEHPVCKTCGKPIDTPPVVEKQPTEKKGFWTKAKNAFIGFRKTCLDFGYVALGAAKGAIYGALTATGVAGAVALRNTVKKAPKTLGLGGKILAGVAGVVVMAGTIFKSKLDANQAKSHLDHRWETGHNG